MKLNRFQKLVLILIGMALCLSIVLNTFAIHTPFSQISKEGYGFFSTLKYTLIDYPVQAITENYKIFGKMWALEEENEILRQQIEGIASMQAKIDEQNRQIKELQEMNELRSVISDYQTISATILNRSLETWNSTLTIDAGSAEGVQENYAVISVDGLIGKVQSVSEHTASVKLLTVSDGSNKVSVKIHIGNGETADAILEKYDFDEQAFVVKLLDSNNTITEKMTVTTSGMGGVFPSGLLIGTVSYAKELSNAIGMDILVKPAADFGDLDYVYVVKRLGEFNE